MTVRREVACLRSVGKLPCSAKLASLAVGVAALAVGRVGHENLMGE